jgi:hypothetical protein
MQLLSYFASITSLEPMNRVEMCCVTAVELSYFIWGTRDTCFYYHPSLSQYSSTSIDLKKLK